jgi:hypothetical protein
MQCELFVLSINASNAFDRRHEHKRLFHDQSFSLFIMKLVQLIYTTIKNIYMICTPDFRFFQNNRYLIP